MGQVAAQGQQFVVYQGVGLELGAVGLFARATDSLDGQRARFFLWSPVALGAGIAGYFALAFEPSLALAFAPLAAALLLKLALKRGTLLSQFVTALVLVALGLVVAKLRVEFVRAPVLQKNLHYAEVKGTVERAETKAPRGQRLTIAVETLDELDEARRPKRVRVRTMKAEPVAHPGDHVTLHATLSPPAKPALPGGFDYGRTAWFEGLGGVGYTLSSPVLESGNAAPSLAAPVIVAIESVRQGINTRIGAVLPGETGAIAKALITGERGGIAKPTNDAYKNSGLFHILSISGLHMVVMAGAVFYSIRLLLAALPWVALNFPIKKWAAVGGILGTLGYLAISGGSFATVRSALMILVMFAAMLLERPALALRNVALAAFLILLFYPESLFDAGFQMSFAAVTALIATYEEIRRRYKRSSEPHPVLRVLMFFGGIIFTTIVASIAVAPFAAYQFHQSQQYAMIANLIAIPICNTIVMPTALVALVLMPFGLEAVGLIPMGWGIDAMSWCANKVAVLPGAVGHLAAMPTLAFVLMVVGGMWLALWQARWRLMGVGLVIAGLIVAPFLARPDVLIARQGELVAVRGADGQLSALPARQAKYELERWLENDGDARSAQQAAKAEGFRCDASGCVTQVKGATLSVARHPSAIADDCARADILVLNVPRPKVCASPAAIVDVFDVYDQGAHALYIEDEGRVRIDTVAAHRGIRPWSEVPEHKRRLPVPKVGEPAQSSGSAALDDGPRDVTTGTQIPDPASRAVNDSVRQRRADRLPAFAGRPEWLARGVLRPDVEDDESAGEPVIDAQGDAP